jgi:hypothetical protein
MAGGRGRGGGGEERKEKSIDLLTLRAILRTGAAERVHPFRLGDAQFLCDGGRGENNRGGKVDSIEGVHQQRIYSHIKSATQTFTQPSPRPPIDSASGNAMQCNETYKGTKSCDSCH